MFRQQLAAGSPLNFKIIIDSMENNQHLIGGLRTEVRIFAPNIDEALRAYFADTPFNIINYVQPERHHVKALLVRDFIIKAQQTWMKAKMFLKNSLNLTWQYSNCVSDIQKLQLLIIL